MVRNIKMSRSTRRWIRRHNRGHTTEQRAAVTIRKHDRHVTLTDMAVPVLVRVTHATAHCRCGASRPAYLTADYEAAPVRLDQTPATCSPPDWCVMVGTKCHGQACAIRDTFARQ